MNVMLTIKQMLGRSKRREIRKGDIVSGPGIAKGSKVETVNGDLITISAPIGASRKRNPAQ